MISKAEVIPLTRHSGGPAAAHLGVDVEVPVGLKVLLLALRIVEQEAVFDDEESLRKTVKAAVSDYHDDS